MRNDVDGEIISTRCTCEVLHTDVGLTWQRCMEIVPKLEALRTIRTSEGNRTFRPLDDSPPRRFATTQWTIRPLTGELFC